MVLEALSFSNGVRWELNPSVMLPLNMTAALAVAVAVLSSTTNMTLMSNVVGSSSVAIENPASYSSEVYPAGVSWMQELEADPELLALATHETAGTLDPKKCNWSDAEITGFPSCGILQYQPSTFVSFVRKYKALPADLSDEEILAALYDPYIQIYITRAALIDGGWRNWYTTFTKLGLNKDYQPAWTPTAQGLVLKK